MKYRSLRWALCVAALLFCAPSWGAPRERVHVIGPGDSLDSLARKYAVLKADIARLNHIDPEALLRDGKRIRIPPPPAHVVRPATMRRVGRISGNRISVRRGPFEKYTRITLLDHNAPLVVTRKAGEWLQVELEDGRSGWIKSEFVRIGGNASREARMVAKRAPARARQSATASRAAAAPRKTARTGKTSRTASAARKSRKIAQSAHERRHRSRQVRRTASSARRSKRPEASPPQADSDIVRTAYAYRGVRYRFGGSSRNGFDCSGFTSHVYSNKGVKLPRTAAQQFHAGRKVSSSEMKPGDLVFFHTTRRGISHVGIYAGKGRFVHASSGGGAVRVDSLTEGYYKNRFRGARRVK